jgi:hypothetical protein
MQGRGIELCDGIQSSLALEKTFGWTTVVMAF